MNIRPATRADAIAINELLGQLGYPQDGAGATADRIQVWADDPALAAYVAESAGDVLGLVAVHVAPFFQRDGSWARVVALVVSTQARRQGIATQLMAAAESFAITQGCVRIDLNSANHRRDAHAFYQHHGYADQTDTSTRFLRSLPQPSSYSGRGR